MAPVPHGVACVALGPLGPLDRLPRELTLAVFTPPPALLLELVAPLSRCGSLRHDGDLHVSGRPSSRGTTSNRDVQARAQALLAERNLVSQAEQPGE